MKIKTCLKPPSSNSVYTLSSPALKNHCSFETHSVFFRRHKEKKGASKKLSHQNEFPIPLPKFTLLDIQGHLLRFAIWTPQNIPFQAPSEEVFSRMSRTKGIQKKIPCNAALILSANSKLVVWGPVVWIPNGSPHKRDCYLRIPRFESQTTNIQTTHLHPFTIG